MSEYREISVEEQKHREINEFVEEALKEDGLRAVVDDIDQGVRKEAEEGTLTENFCQGLFFIFNELYEKVDLEGEDREYFEQVCSKLLSDVDIFAFVSSMSAIIHKIKKGDIDDTFIRPALAGLRKEGYSYKYLKRYVHDFLTQEERQEFGKLISDNKEWVENLLTLDKLTTEFVDENFSGVENTPWTVEDGQKEIVRVLSIATEDLLKHGYIDNTVFIRKGKEVAVLPIRFETSEDKENLVIALKMLSHKMNPDAIITAAGVWTRSPSKEAVEAGEFVPPSEDPNRREAIMVTVETPVAKWHALQLYEKDEEGKIILSELVEPGRHDDMEGNFVFMNNK